MKPKTKVLSAVALFAVVATTTAAFAFHRLGPGEPGGHGGRGERHRTMILEAHDGQIPARMLEHLQDALDLTDDQVADAQKAFATFHENSKPQFEALRQGKEAVDKLLADGATAQAVGEAMIANYKTKKALEAAHDQMFTDFAASLNAEQRTKLEEMHKHMKFMFDAGPGFGPGFGHGGRHHRPGSDQ